MFILLFPKTTSRANSRLWLNGIANNLYLEKVIKNLEFRKEKSHIKTLNFNITVAFDDIDYACF